MAKKGKKAVNQDQLKLSGMNIYLDDKERPVYYDRFTKNGYILSDYEKAYQPYAKRFILAVIISIFMYMFKTPIYIWIGAGVFGYFILELRFRKFLKSLPKILDFKPKRHASYIENTSDEEHYKVYVKLLLYVALGTLLGVNSFLEKYDGIMLTLNIIIILFALYMAIMQMIIIVNRRKAI